MISASELEAMFSDAELVAFRYPASRLFSILRRSVDLPLGWCALGLGPQGDRRVVKSGAVIEQTDLESVLLARTTNLPVRFVVPQLTSGDGFSCEAHVEFAVAVLDDPGELSSFLRIVVGGGDSVYLVDLKNRLDGAVRGAVSMMARQRTAEELVDVVVPAGSLEEFVDALKGPLFEAGLTLVGRPDVRFHSAAWLQIRSAEQDVARRRALHANSVELEAVAERARMLRMEQVAPLLTELRSVAAASPEVGLGTLIRAFSEKQRGLIYDALFAREADGGSTARLVVVAGDSLFYYEVGGGERPVREQVLSGPAGALRSIRRGVDSQGVGCLLVGASTGVYVVGEVGSLPDRSLVVGGSAVVRGGFNAATRVGGSIWGTHSELGVYRWLMNESDEGPIIGVRMLAEETRGASTIRDVEVLNQSMYCAVDHEVLCWDVDGAPANPARKMRGSRSTITAVCPAGDGVYAGNSQGDVLFWPAGSSDRPETVQRGSGRPAESICLVEHDGFRRLVIADTSPCVHVCVPGDSFTARYEAGGQTLRRCAASPGLIVACNELRDRLFAWRVGSPSKPELIIPFGGQANRSIQDFCLIPCLDSTVA